MSNESIKILLVDDEPDILEILSYNLSAEGYAITTASNGVEAVKKAKKPMPPTGLESQVVKPCEPPFIASTALRRTRGKLIITP